MNTRNTKIGMSLVLASMLSMGMTGCGGSSDDDAGAASTAVDVTVERGKVYGATVTDSSTPSKVATQKSGQNVYTFANAPVYPVIVNGGWIDVNGDGEQGLEDVALDIQMKSYTTTITPITTYVADVNKTIREQKLEALVAELNANGVGEDANITVEDLLKVPSNAPADVMITANAIYKDFKEKNSIASTDYIDILSQFETIKGLNVGAGVSAIAYETAVMQNLVNQNLIQTYTQAYIDSLTPAVDEDVLENVSPLEAELLKNNMAGAGLENLRFSSNYTVVNTLGGTGKWSVLGNLLTIITDAEGEIPSGKIEYSFSSSTPVAGSTVTITTDMLGDIQTVSDTISFTTPQVVVTPPTTGESTLPDLGSYSSIFIYKNISQTVADVLLESYSGHTGFQSSNTTASCTDFGFTSDNITSESNMDGVATMKTYRITNSTTYSLRTCTEADYAAIGGGSENILAYYN